MRKNFKNINLIAPLSVSIVVITLGAAFGVLSGRGAFIGMISTSLITLITSLIGGSRYGVSTPTGPMTAAIAVILLTDKVWLTNNSSLDLSILVNLTLILSGLFLLFLVLIKVHRLVKYVPNLVISGFVNGIALLIIIAQLNSITTTADLGIMLLTFFLAYIINDFGKKFEHIVWRLLTSSFCVIVLISFLTYFFRENFSYLDLSYSYENLQIIIPPLNSINFETLKIISPLAFEIALIALLDTLLTTVIMDKKTKKKSQLPRELCGQGISLFGVSLIGGIPGAQSTVPSMMMYQEGGHHRYSKILLAIFCIIFTFIFSGLLKFVPLAVFGGIILKIAFDVADFSSIKYLFKSKSKNKILRGIVEIGTCFTTVLVSLNLAVIGFTILFIYWNKLLPKRLHILDLKSGLESEGLMDEI